MSLYLSQFFMMDKQMRGYGTKTNKLVLKHHMKDEDKDFHSFCSVRLRSDILVKSLKNAILNKDVKGERKLYDMIKRARKFADAHSNYRRIS